MRIQTAPQTREAAARRAVGYSFLAYCLAEPTESNTIALSEAASATAAFLAGEPLGFVANIARAIPSGELIRQHDELFGLSSSPDCPTFESAYYPGEAMGQVERMADIAGFYRAFGVESGGHGLRPDEVCTELEFMAFLCRKQIHAADFKGAPRVAQVQRAQRLFLADHLGQWAPELGRRMAEHASAGSFYAAAGNALAAWVEDDCTLTGADPPHSAGEPVRLEDCPGEDSGIQVVAPDEIPVM